MTQYHFLDESGDPGLEDQAGSSGYFVLAMVQLPHRTPLTELASVRRLFHLPSDFELKYYRARSRQKVAFFEAARKIPFRVRAAAIDKSRLSAQYARVSGQELSIEFIVALAMRASELDIAGDFLIVDGATKAFLRALRVRLSQESRRDARVRPFETIVSGKSSRDDGLQLADMVAGAVRQYVAGEETDYYRMFADRVVDLWNVPENEK